MAVKSIHYRADKAKSKVLHAAAKLFLEKGYTETTLRELSLASGVNYGSLTFVFRNKENILSELVGFVLDSQFEFTEKMLKGKTEDKILFYATETVLQLYMAESRENMREMYNVAYSLPNSARVIYHTITQKLEDAFGDYLPGWKTKDFYEREISSAGIMRNHISVPCDIYFTMERKIHSFLESTFLLYRVSDEKIREGTPWRN